MPAAGPSSSTRSEAFLKGYNACAVGTSRTRNPYAGACLPEPFDTLNKFQDWHDGWNTRFYGEAIYEEEPDP